MAQKLTITGYEPLDEQETQPATGLQIVGFEPLEPEPVARPAPMAARGYTDPASVRVTGPSPAPPIPSTGLQPKPLELLTGATKIGRRDNPSVLRPLVPRLRVFPGGKSSA